MRSSLTNLSAALSALIVAASNVGAQPADWRGNGLSPQLQLGIPWLKVNQVGQNCTASAFEAAMSNDQCGAAHVSCMADYDVLIKRYGQCINACGSESAGVRSLRTVADMPDDADSTGRCDVSCRETYAFAELALRHIGAAGEQCFVRVTFR